MCRGLLLAYPGFTACKYREISGAVLSALRSKLKVHSASYDFIYFYRFTRGWSLLSVRAQRNINYDDANISPPLNANRGIFAKQ